MTFQEAKSVFIAELSSIFPEQEIQTFFFLWVNHYLGISKFDLSLQKQNSLPEILEKELIAVVDRLKNQEPIQYILGDTVFFDLPIKVTPDVLIPRPETEELVKLIIEENKDQKQLKILDIGTGSGCIPITLAKNIDATCFAMDYKQEILDIAQQNAKNNNVEINFLLADILKDDLSFKNEFNIIVSNPPYVLESEKKQMSSNVLKYEPYSALFVSDEDPLLFYSAIAKKAKQWLVDGGKLYFEINENKHKEIETELNGLGFKNITLVKDINDRFRIIKATHEK